MLCNTNHSGLKRLVNDQSHKRCENFVEIFSVLVSKYVLVYTKTVDSVKGAR